MKAQLIGQTAIDIFSETENTFFTKIVDAQLEFLKDEQGKVKSLILYQGGKKIEAEKVK
jgi:hypothetical protein